MKKETNCIHGDKKYQGVNTPIYPSTSSRYIGYEENSYPRYFNTENQNVIVEKLLKLEGGENGLVLSSGMAAISTTLMSVLKAGDHAVFGREVYGGTHKLIMDVFEKSGIQFDFAEGNEVSHFEEKIKANTKVIYFETPSNPLLTITDIRKIASLAGNNNILSVVDNTFASPIHQNPLKMGTDIVVHSGTKYLGGHSDLSFGAVISSGQLVKEITNNALNYGGNLNALDCYLVERSLKTLSIRVKAQSNNAMKIAGYLSNHPKVARVYYPGLPGHEGHDAASAQMTEGFGGMLSFELKEKGKTVSFLKKLRLIAPAFSLGGVETLICQPAVTSHAKMPEKQRLSLGITDELLRLSAGIEHFDDLLEDLEQALG